MRHPALELAPWHDRFPGVIAGSVYAAEPRSRTYAATMMASAGIDVHVDVMAPNEGLPAGVSLTELREIAAVVPRSRVGVHLMGSSEFVDRVLPRILPLRPASVYLPWIAYNNDRARAVRSSGGAPWITVWDECAGAAVPQWPTATAPEGVLVMLIQPGTADRPRLDHLDIVAGCSTELPVAVDGGVTEDVAELSIAAGAQLVVVGRALLLNAKGEEAK